MRAIVGWQRQLPFTFVEFMTVRAAKLESGCTAACGGMSSTPCCSCGGKSVVGVFFNNDPLDVWYDVCVLCGTVVCETPVYGSEQVTQ